MSLLLTLYHISQALASTYTGLLSYASIRKVQTYESQTQKAAKYSNIAEHHLDTTRSTMAAGALSVLTSAASSIYLATSSTSPIVGTGLSIVLAVGVTVAHTHVSNYWRGKAKVPVPGAGDYNDAITTSNQMRSLLGGLAASWGVAAVWYLLAWVL